MLWSNITGELIASAACPAVPPDCIGLCSGLLRPKTDQPEIMRVVNDIRDILVRQVLNPVLWEDSMRRLLSEGIDQMYEIGPGKVLKGLMKRIDRKLDVVTVNDSP